MCVLKALYQKNINNGYLWEVRPWVIFKYFTYLVFSNFSKMNMQSPF